MKSVIIGKSVRSFGLLLFAMTSLSLGQSKFSTQYSYPGMTAGLNTSGGIWTDQDFGIAFANPGGADALVRVQLISDNPSYQFQDGQVGTYNYNGGMPYLVQPSYNVVLNVVGVAIAHGNPTWTGTVSLWSTNGLPFYPFPPSGFTASGTGFTSLEAVYNTWANGYWPLPITTDDSNSHFISPYGNYYHNNNPWDRGWNTTITVYNRGSSPSYYRVVYNASYHDIQCVVQGARSYSAVVYVPNGSFYSGNIVNLFGFSTTAEDVSEGTIEVYPILGGSVSGTSVYVSVSPNSTGTPLCGPGATAQKFGGR